LDLFAAVSTCTNTTWPEWLSKKQPEANIYPQAQEPNDPCALFVYHHAENLKQKTSFHEKSAESQL